TPSTSATATGPRRDAFSKPSAHHPDHPHHVPLTRRGAGELLPLQDPVVDLDRHGSGIDPQSSQVVEQRRGSGQLHRLAVDGQLHRKALMPAKPDAPARWHSSARSKSTPPIASTGTDTARHTSRSASRPTAGRPACEGVSKTGPKTR